MAYMRRGLGDCNVAGGYSLQRPSCYLGPQCMTAADFATAQVLCDSPVQPPAVNLSPCVNCGDPGMLGHPMLNPPGLVYPPVPPVVTPPAPVVLNSPGLPPLVVSSAAASSSSSVLDSAIAWVQANPLMAAGAALGLFFLFGKK